MEHNIDTCLSRVQGTVADFAKFKGELIGTCESVINKDILSFKLERVTK